MTKEQTTETSVTPKTVKMMRFKNVSEVALSIPELNTIVPKDGYSAPMSTTTPTTEAYLKGNLFVKEEVDISEVATAAPVGAVMQGDVSVETCTKGPVDPCIAGPDKHTISGPNYIPIRKSNQTERVAGYDNQRGIRDAVSNTVVSIGTDNSPINQYGEIPSDEATRLIRTSGASFSTEVSGGDYIADEAQKIIASAAGVAANPPPAPVIPKNVPEDLVPFFQKTALQKKIYIYKTSDVDMLNKIVGFERDPATLSCISERMTELEK